MFSSWLPVAFLLTAAFSLSTWLQPWFANWSGNRSKSTDLLSVALGDSRRLFAKHFYVKADAYFHSGYYPTIFDTKPDGADSLHMSGGGGHQDDLGEFLGQPKDWIDRFSRHFYPSAHRHLGEGSEHHDGDGEHDAGGEQRELLPWLKLSAQLDPERPETYVVAAFWLRSQLTNSVQAEQFLRQGLQANPGHYEILFELGRIYDENRKDPNRARNVWELALKDWRARQAAGQDPQFLVYDQLLGHLARLEEQQQNYAQALVYLRELRTVSPTPLSIDKWMDELKQKLPKQ
jgi:tetratricopeptide (TPR) repeat protein